MTMNKQPTHAVLALLDAEPLDVRNAYLSKEIDKAFEGAGHAFITDLCDVSYFEAPEEWSDINKFLDEEGGGRNMKAYSELCFMYACFILCLEGEEDSF